MNAKYVIKKDNHGFYYWILSTGNNRLLHTSKPFMLKEQAQEDIELFRNSAKTNTVQDDTPKTDGNNPLGAN